MKHDRLASILIEAARMVQTDDAAIRMRNWKGNAGNSAGNFVEVALEVRDRAPDSLADAVGCKREGRHVFMSTSSMDFGWPDTEM